MSISWSQPLGAVAESLQISWVLLVLTVIALAVTAAKRAVSIRRLPGPARIPTDRSAWPLAGMLFGAMGIYFLAISACANVWAILAPKYGATTQPMESDAGIALLNTVPSLVVLAALIAGDNVVFDAVRQDLGFDAKRLRRGLVYGFGAAVLVLPPLYLASQLMEIAYKAVHYEHPTEHPMLHVLGEGPSPWVKAAIIIGACLIAPVFEELVFRGHLQTLLLRGFESFAIFLRPMGNMPGPAPVPVQPVSESISSSAPPVAPELHPAPEPPSDPNLDRALGITRSKVPTLLAILLTSFLFASVHPAWSFPIIFLLALVLGYAYERTGNLWLSITIHATFNTVSTLLFLAGVGGQ